MRAPHLFCLSLVSCLAFASAAAAQQAPLYRVVDLNPALEETSSYPAGFVSVGALTYFMVNPTGSSQTRDLWQSDGTELGTHRSPAFSPGTDVLVGYPPIAARGSSIVAAVTAAANDPNAAHSELRVSDGTLVQTINLAPNFLDSLSSLMTVGNVTYFAARDGTTYQLQLWKTDGTPSGTVPVASFGSSGSISPVGVSGSLLFFNASVNGNPATLWRSDGTAAGTYSVALGGGGAAVSAGGLLFFLSANNLWRSDGTAAGTVAVTSTGDVYDLALQKAGPGLNGDRVLIARVVSPNTPSQILSIHRVNPAVPTTVSPVFSWAAPTPGAWIRLLGVGSQVFAGVGDGVTAGGAASFSLWRFVGPSSTATQLKVFAPLGAGVASFLGASDTEFFFSADDGVTGTEVWHSDGTALGTQLVSDVRFGPPSPSIGNSLVSNGLLFLAMNDGEHGTEPWIANATSEVLLRNIESLPGSSRPTRELPDDAPPILSACSAAHSCGIYKSDGTQAGTQEIFDYTVSTPIYVSHPDFDPAVGAARAGTFLFSSFEEASDTRLFRSDGTPAGTSLVYTWPSTPTSGATVNRIHALPSGWLMEVYTNPNGYWFTDGTPGGTAPLTPAIGPIGTYFPSAFPDPVAGRVLIGYQRAVNPYPLTASELWATDGTAAGTLLLDNFGNGIGVPAPHLFAADSVYHVTFVHRGRIYGSNGAPGSTVLADFSAATAPYEASVYTYVRAVGIPEQPFLAMVNSPLFGVELWRSHSSGLPTLVRDISVYTPGGGAATPELVNVGSRVFFAAADDAHGGELWESDGTEAGTVMVRDIVPGPYSSTPAYPETPLYLAVGDRLVFVACDDAGCEPWVTDGSEAGTHRLMDVNRGPAGSRLALVGRTASRILFSADDGVTGRELWALRVDAVDDPPIVLGDLDGDGDFDAADRALFAGAFGEQAGDESFLIAADLDSDGAVTPLDQDLWDAAHGATATPIPALASHWIAAGLALALGALALTRSTPGAPSRSAGRTCT